MDLFLQTFLSALPSVCKLVIEHTETIERPAVTFNFSKDLKVSLLL